MNLRADDGRVFVIEVNGIPSWHGLQQTTASDIAGAVADHATAVAGRHAGDRSRL